MNIFEFVFAFAVVMLLIIVVILIFTKKGRMFAKAAINSLFTEANRNPKVVAEYYDEKIRLLEESYCKADDAYRKAVGEKNINDRNIKELEKQLNEANRYVLVARENGDTENAREHAKEAMGIKAELDAKKESVPVFEDAMKSAEQVKQRAEKAIQQVRTRKQTDITRAERGKATQDIYSQFDKNRISSDIDRVLEQFSDYADEQEKMAIGAKASWEASYEAKKISAQEKAIEYQTDDYIANLVASVVEEKDKA